jgi:hypothetical protein
VGVVEGRLDTAETGLLEGALDDAEVGLPVGLTVGGLRRRDEG